MGALRTPHFLEQQSSGPVHRWIDAGLLRAWKRRGPVKTMRYVSRADVVAMLECEEPTARPPRSDSQTRKEEQRRRQAETRAGLARHGLEKYLDLRDGQETQRKEPR